MRIYLIKLIVVVTLFTSIQNCFSQEKYKISIGTFLTHYKSIETANFEPASGYASPFFSPGAELILSRRLIENVYLKSGFNFQNVKLSSSPDGSQWRFHFSEISIPVFLSKSFELKNKKYFILSSGLTFGQLVNVNAETITSFGWEKREINEYIPFYSNNKSFIDLYFDLGYCVLPETFFSLTLSPFVKYRINPTWLNNHHKKTQIGLKIVLSKN